MKHLLPICLLLASAPTSYAQLGIGPELGFNLSDLKDTGPSFREKSRLRAGLHAGIHVSARTDRTFCIQTGLYYHTKGSNNAEYALNAYAATHTGIHSLQAPLYLTYQTNPGRYNRYFVGAGGFIDYNMGGVYYSFGNREALKMGSDPKDDVSRLDYGIGAQAGFRVNNGLNFRVQYQYGLPDIAPSDRQIKTRAFAVTLAYVLVARKGKASEVKSIGQ